MGNRIPCTMLTGNRKNSNTKKKIGVLIDFSLKLIIDEAENLYREIRIKERMDQKNKMVGSRKSRNNKINNCRININFYTGTLPKYKIDDDILEIRKSY